MIADRRSPTISIKLRRLKSGQVFVCQFTAVPFAARLGGLRFRAQLRGRVMSSAIELNVAGYSRRLQEKQLLESPRMQRRRLVVELQARTGLHCRSSIAQIEQDIIATEAGLMTLSGPVAG